MFTAGNRVRILDRDAPNRIASRYENGDIATVKGYDTDGDVIILMSDSYYQYVSECQIELVIEGTNNTICVGDTVIFNQDYDDILAGTIATITRVGQELYSLTTRDEVTSSCFHHRVDKFVFDGFQVGDIVKVKNSSVLNNRYKVGDIATVTSVGTGSDVFCDLSMFDGGEQIIREDYIELVRRPEQTQITESEENEPSMNYYRFKHQENHEESQTKALLGWDPEMSRFLEDNNYIIRGVCGRCRGKDIIKTYFDDERWYFSPDDLELLQPVIEVEGETYTYRFTPECIEESNTFKYRGLNSVMKRLLEQNNNILEMIYYDDVLKLHHDSALFGYYIFKRDDFELVEEWEKAKPTPSKIEPKEVVIDVDSLDIPRDIKTSKQKGFKSIFIECEEMKTPSEKVIQFYHLFKEAIRIAKDETLESPRFKMIDDLTFSFTVELPEEEKEKQLKNKFKEVKSECFSYLLDEVLETMKSAILEKRTLNVSEVIEVKKVLFGWMSIKPDNTTLYDPDFLAYNIWLQGEILAIREGEIKPSRLISRNIKKLLSKALTKLDTDFKETTSTINSRLVNASEAIDNLLNNLSHVNVDEKETYYITFDSVKIAQCSTNTTEWRSCYNLVNGEYRNSALYMAQESKSGMLYSLDRHGRIKRRRLFTMDEKSIVQGDWYPSRPSGMTNAINYNIRQAMMLSEAYDENNYGISDRIKVGDVYPDFYYNRYLMTEKGYEKQSLKDVYNRSGSNPIFSFIYEKGYNFSTDVDEESGEEFYSID